MYQSIRFNSTTIQNVDKAEKYFKLMCTKFELEEEQIDNRFDQILCIRSSF
jgi:coproporphyrinogen III oxidase-like Fe-S oxidoreductase